MVSVIVPCYNQGRFLADAIASVLTQTRSNVECIVVDDGSSDDTAEVAARFGDRIRLVRRKNGGPAAARNTGLRHASGEFVHFLDADDFMLPGFYASIVRALKERPNMVAAFTGWVFVDSSGNPLGEGEVEEGEKDWFHFMLERCLCPCHALVLRRRVFDRVGFFDETLRCSDDWDMWLRIAASGEEFMRVSGNYACYRQHGNSMSMGYQRMLEHGYQVIQRHVKHHRDCSKCIESARRGKKNISHYVWNLTQSKQMKELLAQGRLVDYAIRTIRQTADDPLWLKWNLMTLIHSKRLVGSALLRPLGIDIGQRQTSK